MTTRWRCPPDSWWGSFAAYWARRREAHGVQQFVYPLAGGRGGQVQEVVARPGDGVLDGVQRVERAVRVLEDHLHLAVQPAQAARA
jgi:hypothetical protein